jgi:hypothetical protein
MSKTRKDSAASEFDFSEIEKKALKAVAGLYEIPEHNEAAGANTGKLARMDKSFSSVPDFFWKLIFGRDKK